MHPALKISPELLVGRWRAVYAPFTVDWEFDGNGTFSGSIARNGKRISDFTGVWVLEGTLLQSEYTSDTSGVVDAGYIDRDVFLELNNNYFIVQTRTGLRRYDRVK